MYLLFGIVTAILGALPIGAANLVVLNAAIQKNTNKVNQLTLSAGIGELSVVVFSMLFSMQLVHFFQEFYWIRFLFIALFLSLGIYFLKFQNRIPSSASFRISKRPTKPFVLGFLLAVVNPPVLLYWIAAITVLNQYAIPITNQTLGIHISSFLVGVFLGKIVVLYGYAKWGKRLANQHKPATTKMYTTIGIAFLLISIIQSIHLIY